MNDHEFRIIEAMAKFGGSFAQSIAAAAKRADLENYRKLRDTFPELWKRYEAFVPIPIKPIAP